METTVKNEKIHSFLALYDMQTQFFYNAIEGISDEDAHNRMNTKANHVAWLTGSLVQQRYELANELGVEGKPSSDDLFKNHQGIQDNVTYPSMLQFRKDWEAISPRLRKALSEVNDVKLNSLFEMEGMQMPYFDLIAFTIYREANCIGQIALYRRLLGYAAMKYM